MNTEYSKRPEKKTGISTYLLIITLNENGLHFPSKDEN
jgi:hypothetical protein